MVFLIPYLRSENLEILTWNTAFDCLFSLNWKNNTIISSAEIRLLLGEVGAFWKRAVLEQYSLFPTTPLAIENHYWQSISARVASLYIWVHLENRSFQDKWIEIARPIEFSVDCLSVSGKTLLSQSRVWNLNSYKSCTICLNILKEAFMTILNTMNKNVSRNMSLCQNIIQYLGITLNSQTFNESAFKSIYSCNFKLFILPMKLQATGKASGAEENRTSLRAGYRDAGVWVRYRLRCNFQYSGRSRALLSLSVSGEDTRAAWKATIPGVYRALST